MVAVMVMVGEVVAVLVMVVVVDVAFIIKCSATRLFYLPTFFFYPCYLSRMSLGKY